MSVFDLSLVIPTVHRVDELDRLLRSLCSQDGRARGQYRLQILVVDQNSDERLRDLKERYSPVLEMDWIRTESRGQSRAKNIGLEVCRGRWVGFPDDDCFFDDNGLDLVVEKVRSLPVSTALFGRGVDFETGQDLLSYPPNGFTIESSMDSRIFLGLQIAQFFPWGGHFRTIRFDERFSSGSQWGSGEETDFAMEFIQRGGRIVFDPQITVLHPRVDVNTMSRDKLRRYAEGFGALCAKRRLWWEWGSKTAKQWIGAILYLVLFRPGRARKHLTIAIGRGIGFWSYWVGGRNGI